MNVERYIEVFGGGGWVLFHKEPSPFEVFNDFNADLVNLYRCIRDKPEELVQRLEYTLNAREDFEHIRKLLKSKAELTDIQRAAGYYQLIRQSYASTLDSFGGQPTGMWATFPVIRQAAERLQRVVIDNRDFEKVIGQYDRENSLFYCDPPYWSTEDYYENVVFGREDHQRLADCLLRIQGRFLLSYNYCDEIVALYKRSGIWLEELTRPHSMAHRFEPGTEFRELLISNYDTTEKYRQQWQDTLFGLAGEMNVLSERKYL